MKTVLIAVAAALAIVGAMNFMNAPATPRMLTSQSPVDAAWNMWKRQQGRSYGVNTEEAYRKSVFTQNYNKIQEFNSKPQTSTVRLNKFADLTTGEFKAQYANLKRNNRAFGAKKPKAKLSNVAVPDSYDARTDNLVNAVKDQGQCGSCWAFSTVAAIESSRAKSGLGLGSFSEQMLVDCSHGGNQGCNGGNMDVALAWVAQNPLDTESNYPYTAEDGTCQAFGTNYPGKISSGQEVAANKDAFKSAIYQYGAVSIGIEADEMAFQFYDGGVITSGCGSSLDHGVAAIGWDQQDGEDYFIVRNSWGADWGNSGYVNIAPNQCGMLLQGNVAVVNA